jgi:NADH-quinone oxidoreductase subunit J
MLAGVLLIALLTLGGVGLYLAMPGGRLNVGRAALVVLAGAAAALVVFLLPSLSAGADRGWFIALALIGLWGAIRVVTHRKPVYSALYFILVIVAVTGMLVLMQAEFLAAAVVIIYAGAILVTYVFVIMLAQQEGGPARYDRQAREPFVGALTGFILLAIIGTRVFTAGSGEASLPPIDEATAGSVKNVGTHLLTQFVVGLELAGVLLLAAMVGAIAIARRRGATSEGSG